MCGHLSIYIVYGESAFVWTYVVDAKRPRQTSRRMTVGGHLYICVVRQLGILAYIDNVPRLCCPLVTYDARLDKLDTWTCRREP